MTVVFILLWTSEGVIKPESAAGEELVHVGECSTTVANCHPRRWSWSNLKAQ